jgi:hypothetical protein
MNTSHSLKIGAVEMKISNVNLVDVIDTGMIYPILNSLTDKEVKECSLSFDYVCDEVKCNFDSCLNAIRQSSELKSKCLRDTSVLVVEALSNNQELFTVREVGGFVFQATGKGQFIVKNRTGTDFPGRRYGFLDLTETRRRFIHQYELQKLNSFSTGQVGVGVVVGFFLTAGFLKYLKKI